MSDRSATWIRIGGTLKPENANEFVELIVGLGEDWGESLDVLGAIKLVEGPQDGPLCLFDNECPGGEFDDLEEFCQEHGLSYARGDDGHYAYHASIVLWKPGMVSPKSWVSAVELGAYLSAGEIREHLANCTLENELLLMEEADAFPEPFVGCKVPEAEDEPEVEPLVQTKVERLIEAAINSGIPHLRELADAVQKELADGE